MGRARSWRKTVVVGAGPVGSLAAIYAANRGDEVEVYDLRPDLRAPTTSPTTLVKSINLALSERGITALRNTGYPPLLDAIFATTIPMHGRMIHTASPTGTLHSEPQAYDVHGRFQRSIDRNELSKLLLDKLDTMPNVTLHFNQKLTGADFDAKRAWFEDQNSKPATSPDNENPSRRAPEHEVTFDLMIGADGAHSAVRYHLMKYARVDFTQSYIDCLWSEFTMTADPTTTTFGPDGYKISPNHLHIWPANTHMFIALPTHADRFVCTLFGTTALFSELENATPEDFTTTFDALFPGVTGLIPASDLHSQFTSNPHLPLITIKCTPHTHGSSVAILGDAANAMPPFYGQGMNAGLESVRTLFSLLDEAKQSHTLQTTSFTSIKADESVKWHDPDARLQAALREYSHVRVPDAYAITDLALGNYAEMARGVTSRRYKARKWIEERLDAWAPGLGWRTQYARVSFGGERYSEVVRRGRWQGQVLNRLFDVAGLGVVGGVVYGVLKYTRFGRELGR